MEMSEKSKLLRLLPSIDGLLKTRTATKIQAETGAKHLTKQARNVIETMRGELFDQKNTTEFSRQKLLETAEIILAEKHQAEQTQDLQKVINATGVIIHTNLGRAPLSENAKKAIIESASGYCNLEYDSAVGRRGRRGAKVEKLLAELTGAEDALIVNNCAAAAFLILSVLAGGGETIVSRGELVEIGGDFRVPDVMTQAGAILREVGTTNRTKIADYENAIGENTKLIAKIHPSNFRIVGFTKSVGIADLAELARRKNILLYEDAGSGAIFDLSKYGLTDEPVITKSVTAGADIVSFSGDKLLGGAQSGLIVGRAEVIEKIRKHPLYRVLRVDKLICAALQATLESFRRETQFVEIPVLKMLAQTNAELKLRTESFAAKLSDNIRLNCRIVGGNSVVGGGSAPAVQPKTWLLKLEHLHLSAEKFEEKLRTAKLPVIARIAENRVVIDLRTVSESEEPELLRILAEI